MSQGPWPPSPPPNSYSPLSTCVHCFSTSFRRCKHFKPNMFTETFFHSWMRWGGEPKLLRGTPPILWLQSLCWAYFVGCIASPNRLTEEANPILARALGSHALIPPAPAHLYCATPQNKRMHTSQPSDKTIGGTEAVTEPPRGSALHRRCKGKVAALGI